MEAVWEELERLRDYPLVFFELCCRPSSFENESSGEKGAQKRESITLIISRFCMGLMRHADTTSCTSIGITLAYPALAYPAMISPCSKATIDHKSCPLYSPVFYTLSMSPPLEMYAMQPPTLPSSSRSNEDQRPQCWKDVEAETGFSTYRSFLEASKETGPRFRDLLAPSYGPFEYDLGRSLFLMY